VRWSARLIDKIELDIVEEQIIGQTRVDERGGEDDLIAPTSDLHRRRQEECQVCPRRRGRTAATPDRTKA